MNIREWTDTTPAELCEAPGTYLWIEDGTHGHACRMKRADTVPALLDDYAAGYRAGAVGDRVTVGWVLCRDGLEVERGRHTFTAVLS